MMKKLMFAAAFAAAACTSQVPQDQCQMEIDMENLPDTIYMYYANTDRSGYDKCDTLIATNGKCTHTATLDGACMAMLRSEGDTPMHITLYLLPGNKLVLTGDATSSTVELGGSEAYKQLQEATSITTGIQSKAMELNNEYMSRIAAGEAEDSVQAAVQAKYEAIVDEYKQAVAEYIEANPSSLGSLLLLTQANDTDDFEKYDAIVTEDAKNGVMAPIYNKAKERYEKELERRTIKEKLTEGAVAPDFTLTDIEGNDLSLSSLRGKYLVLDFWGSWCGWCIKGMPEMKKYYSKYSGKLEILGIDCRDTEEKWKQAVADNALPWKHVKNGEGDSDITTMYAIEGYPTKIILDPEGKIVKYIVGEDPVFYTTLDEIL